MINRLKFGGVLAFFVCLTACTTGIKSGDNALNHNDTLNQLTDWMSGSFNSNKQSIADEEYFDINLEMHPIWQDRKDGVWLYVEQALSKSLDKPYRQRVYQVTQVTANDFESKVYSLKEPKKFIGGQDNKELFNSIGPDDLVEREGCSVFLKYDGNQFSGSTDRKSCKSNMRDASYATSIVTVTGDKIESWDQGFDANDKQVWGAVKGAYIFDRK